jgi:hypothetical protein
LEEALNLSSDRILNEWMMISFHNTKRRGFRENSNLKFNVVTLMLRVKVKVNTRLKVKTRVSLSMKRRRMGEWRYISTHFYIGTKRRFNGKIGEAQGRSGHFGEEKNIYILCQESKQNMSCCVTQPIHYTHYVVCLTLLERTV